MSKRFAKHDIVQAVLCVAVLAASVVLKVSGIASSLPYTAALTLAAALALCIFARGTVWPAVITAFASASIMYVSFEAGDGWSYSAGYDVPAAAASLILTYFAVRLLVLGGADRVILQVILNRTQSRRGYFAAICVLSVLFSAVPELGCLVSGGLCARAGEKLGVSREKTAFLVNASSVTVRWLLCTAFCVEPILEFARMGLDSAGGQAVNAADFLGTTLVFLYFPICMAVVLIMSALKLRDTGGILKAELESRKTCSVQELKAISGSEMSGAGLCRLIVPTALAALALAAGLAFGLGVPLSMLISSAAMLVSAAILMLATGNAQALSGVLPVKADRSLPVMLISVLLIYLALSGPAPFEAIGGLINENLPLWLLPLVTVIISALLAFLAGNPLIPLAIVLPAAIPAGWLASEQAIYYTMATAAAMSGSLAGALCSPHAPTSVISASVCGCGLRAHMKTQAPYVLLVLAVACIFGYLPISLGLTAPFGLFCTIFAAYAIFETLSRSPDTRARTKK